MQELEVQGLVKQDLYYQVFGLLFLIQLVFVINFFKNVLSNYTFNYYVIWSR